MLDAQIDWQSLPIQEAALTLHKHERVRRTHANAPLVDELIASNWLVPEDEDDNFMLSVRGRSGLVELLDLRLPEWREWLDALEGDQLMLGEAFEQRWGFIKEQLRSDLPRVLNRRSLQQALLGNPETPLPEHLYKELPQIELSDDRCLHLRGNMDLRLVRKHGTAIELKKIWRQLSEAVLPERDFRQIQELDGELPYLVMTIEDRGVFLDIDLPENLLAIWVAPDQLPLAGDFLRFLPQFVPHVHFGDLDHQGLVIAERLAIQSQRPVRRFIPAFWKDYLKDFASTTSDSGKGKGAAWRGPVLSVQLLRDLMTSNRWLAQAPLLLDARLHEEMRKLMD
ncbi:hypothetical protein [Marinospirillum alkaliphilum]|uniref:Wadjet protein JetD C-terminal domain-containing protein n=1 Tax=Marinospirillum alkaliphilum DSM 21637 TaxID=1122209 RepID=A0A1K1YEF2_9GAMM|nr:hypothetical protein [Marinospirillum alkaliphilum]SFX60279.1 hypothetical protein SAMN02745752_02202 [Marinospirillum alkaliphilum DSM 21637]